MTTVGQLECMRKHEWTDAEHGFHTHTHRATASRGQQNSKPLHHILFHWLHSVTVRLRASQQIPISNHRRHFMCSTNMKQPPSMSIISYFVDIVFFFCAGPKISCLLYMDGVWPKYTSIFRHKGTKVGLHKP